MGQGNAGMDNQLDLSRRFVRITGEKRGGFIEFDYAIAEPDLFIEMILSQSDFEEFCRSNKVVILRDKDETLNDSDWDWRLSDARQTRFK